MAAECDACRAPIVWVETENGKMMPIDRDPIPRDAERQGNLIKTGTTERIVRGRHETVPTVMVIKADDQTAADRYISHFATCTNPQRFRRNR